MASLALPTFLDRVLDAHLPCRLAVVVAHPDDEIIGASALLGRVSHPLVVDLTDGAPPGGRELPTRRLGLVDLRVVRSLAWAAREVAALLLWEAPDLVVTHAYEGGHPDHDAAAFICHAAFALCDRATGPVPTMLAEMPLYHDENGACVIGRFLPPARGERVIVLSAEEEARKRRRLAALRRPEHVTTAFPTAVERFRPASRQDFQSPPHPGVLHYEEEPWDVSWPLFRQCAKEAARELDLGSSL